MLEPVHHQARELGQVAQHPAAQFQTLDAQPFGNLPAELLAQHFLDRRPGRGDQIQFGVEPGQHPVSGHQRLEQHQ